jgi:hypothetical protein
MPFQHMAIQFSVAHVVNHWQSKCGLIMQYPVQTIQPELHDFLAYKIPALALLEYVSLVFQTISAN